jgi:hypothetical protein
MKPWDIIRVKQAAGGYRVWQVSAVKLGAVHQEDVIEIESLERSENGPLRVPLHLLELAIFHNGVDYIEAFPPTGQAVK